MRNKKRQCILRMSTKRPVQIWKLEWTRERKRDRDFEEEGVGIGMGLGEN